MFLENFIYCIEIDVDGLVGIFWFVFFGICYNFYFERWDLELFIGGKRFFLFFCRKIVFLE